MSPICPNSINDLTSDSLYSAFSKYFDPTAKKIGMYLIEGKPKHFM